MAEQHRGISLKPSAKPQLILVRAPETGIPQYISCAAGLYRKLIVFTIVTAAAALAVTLNIVFAAKRKHQLRT
ncbi:MAG: hypothetical protein LBI42_08245 [Chitinispirillales bacterium]|jgi:hypothetical protein|nr:hypothetical protein [Chitinispirillales bacterium]